MVMYANEFKTMEKQKLTETNLFIHLSPKIQTVYFKVP